MQAHRTSYDTKVSRFAGAETACGSCFKDLEASSGNLLLCSRCRITAYCSKDCQVAAWKRHKKECANHSDYNNKLETMAVRDLATYLEESGGDVLGIALRTVFKLDKPDDMTATHFLRLYLEWEPTPAGATPNLRDRFTLTNWRMIPYAEWLEHEPMSDQDRKMYRETVPLKGNAEAGLLRARDNFVLGYQLWAVAKGTDIAQSYFAHHILIERSCFKVVPLKEMKPRPDWWETLQAAVKESVRCFPFHIVEDLFATVGPKEALKIVRSKSSRSELEVLERSRRVGLLRVPCRLV